MISLSGHVMTSQVLVCFVFYIYAIIRQCLRHCFHVIHLSCVHGVHHVNYLAALKLQDRTTTKTKCVIPRPRCKTETTVFGLQITSLRLSLYTGYFNKFKCIIVIFSNQPWKRQDHNQECHTDQDQGRSFWSRSWCPDHIPGSDRTTWYTKTKSVIRRPSAICIDLFVCAVEVCCCYAALLSVLLL